MSRKLLIFCLLSVGFTIFLLFGTPIPPAAVSDGPETAAQPATSHGRHAITTFLGLHGTEKDQNDSFDTEYLNIRTLLYQLLHAPTTKLRNPVPVVVLVNQHVRESKRQRLREDGATVVEVEGIFEDRWGDMATKLRVFDPTVVPYDKLLFMDASTVLTHPIDKIFDDLSAVPTTVEHSFQATSEDDSLLPKKFVMVASPVVATGSDSSDSAQESASFCNGLFMYSPSTDLFQYYRGLLGQSGLFDMNEEGHDLLNYAHRRGGPMPWKSLHGSWYLNWPGDNDLNGKTPLLHTKWQARDGEASYLHSAVDRYAQARRWEMEGFWIAKAERST
ncbi:hypothetical protein N7456_009870 [Penicillium angulare]|uniref:Glycosyltransferase family 8 protein n=1 Tax=Penicillium angulare TaxID=116970 RepID=A0A9W9F5R0_9EURO|nr:hypothetical protein N7456_009870 [Penicillium angulare]